MRETLSLTLMPHPVSGEKDSTITCPSVMDMNSSTTARDCTCASSGSRSDAADASAAFAASSAAAARFSSAALIFACISGVMSSNPAGSPGAAPPPAVSPTAPLFFASPRLPLYAPRSWYITPRSVRLPPPSSSFMRATRCRVMPKNRRRSARSALMIIPSYSTISSSVASSISSCGESLAISRETHQTGEIVQHQKHVLALLARRLGDGERRARHRVPFRHGRVRRARDDGGAVHRARRS